MPGGESRALRLERQADPAREIDRGQGADVGHGVGLAGDEGAALQFPIEPALGVRIGDLVRMAEIGELGQQGGRARMGVKGKSQQIEVMFGPKYNTVVVFSPKPSDSANRAAPIPYFICFEPMAGITDAMNLAYRGLYHELQTLPPGEIWQESFWIRPSGF